MAEKSTPLALVVDVRGNLSVEERDVARRILTNALMRSSAAMKDLGLNVRTFSFIHSTPRERRTRV